MVGDPVSDTPDLGQAERPVFVDGIGPPLNQIREDYADIRTTHARDTVALIDAYLALAARLAQAERKLEQVRRFANAGKDASNITRKDMAHVEALAAPDPDEADA